MKIGIQFVACLLAFSSVTVAGPRVGNGGDVLLCQGVKDQPSIQLLDHYEAVKFRSVVVHLGSKDIPYYNKVQTVLQNLARLNPSRAALYHQWLSDFQLDAFFTTENIMPIADVGPATLPKGCKVAQIAVHQDPDLPGDHRYTVYKPYWDRLDNDGKAGLILHEIIYREMIAQRPAHENSKYVRYMNAILSSDQMLTMSLQDYYNKLVSMMVATMDTQMGLPITIVDEDSQGSLAYPAVKFADANTVSFAAKTAPLYQGVFYNWFGNAVVLQSGMCLQSSLSFLAGGAPSCLDALVYELNVNQGSLQGKISFKDGASHLLNIRQDVLREQFNQWRFSSDVAAPMVVFTGTVNGKAVTAEGHTLILDQTSNDVKGFE